MIRVQLPDRDRNALEAEFRPTADRKLRDRLQIVLMADRGRRPADIAADLGISTRTAPRWLNAYLEKGLDGLRPRKAKGNTGKVPAALADEVKGWVVGGPTGCGLDRANWAYEEPARHLYQAHGIEASRSAMVRFCRKLGVRVCRPAYRFLRADPAKQAAARAESADLKRGRKPAAWSC